MRKAWLSLALSLLCISPCLAAACYGTRMPQQKRVSLGLETHTVFKRYLENEYGKARSTQQFLLLSWGLFDWLSIDLKGGAGNIKQRPAGSSEADYPYGFAGGYGLRLRLYDKDKLKAAFGFQHISIHPESQHINEVKNKAILDDWQTSLLVSRTFGKWTPYLGARWSRMDYIHRQGADRKRKMSDLTKSTGLIAGAAFSLTEKYWFNLEGLFLDSQALAFSLNYDF